MCQALLNVFTVLGLAPLTGVPLPFISYGSSNLLVLLAAVGLLLNVARRGQAGREPAAGPGPSAATRGGGRGRPPSCARAAAPRAAG